jgi:hypothetical protein
MPKLTVSVDGVDIQQVYLHSTRTTLGRRPDNHIVLPDLAVSGAHCAFTLQGLSGVLVEDLGSTNGTYINGRMVQLHLLEDADEITIGKFKIHYASTNELTEESKTSAMHLDDLSTPKTTGAQHASLKVLSGSSTGLEIPVVKAVATFGKPGVSLVVIAHRRQGYYVSCMDSTQPPTLNGKPISDDPVLLAHRDILELAGTAMEFVLR